MKYIFIIIFIFTGCSIKTDNIYLKLPSLFSDGVILQRDTTISIWGFSKPNSNINISTSWGVTLKEKSDSFGNWKVLINSGKAGGPHEIEINSVNEEIKIRDILFGEVWLAAGQSNMEMDFDYCCNTTDSSAYEINSANYPNIRMFNVKKNLSYDEINDLDGSWISAEGDQITDFSAVGYFFAKNLHHNLNIPVGIIHASWGGSRTEAWTSHEVLSKIEEYQDSFDKLKFESVQNEKLRKFLTRYTSKPMPSTSWDLFLGEFIRNKKPSINYLDYFIDDWRSSDSLGKEIIKGEKDVQNWLVVKSRDEIETYINSKDFIGAVLFKNQFIIENVEENIFLEINPGKDIKWGLLEYDIFINGYKIFSTLIDIDLKDYKFNKEIRTVEIAKNFLKNGKNKIFVRNIGQPSLGTFHLKSINNNKTIKLQNWELNILGEEFFQIDNYVYPYTSLYSYEDKNIDFSKRPKKTYLTHNTSGSIYNGMLNPLIPFTIQGVIWYQGESQIGTGDPKFRKYSKLMPLMVEDWRKKWGSNFPFYFAQIAPYFNYQGMLPYFQKVQSNLTKVIPNSEIIVLNDIGENYDIHPSNKHDVGFRFSQVALKNNYGFDITASGPIYSHIKVKKDKINIFFTSDKLELKIDPNSNSSFEIAGKDKNYYNASVKLFDNYIEAFSDSVLNPSYIRYAWSDTASATLFNEDGWPASLFSNE